jgi:hypothetical protein
VEVDHPDHIADRVDGVLDNYYFETSGRVDLYARPEIMQGDPELDNYDDVPGMASTFWARSTIRRASPPWISGTRSSTPVPRARLPSGLSTSTTSV